MAKPRTKSTATTATGSTALATIHKLYVDPAPIALVLAGLVLWGLFARLDLFVLKEQAIVGVDPVGYYAWVRSALWDHDLDFENEYRALRNPFIARGDTITDPDGPRTVTGKLGNMFSIGPGLLWAPFLIAAHLGIGPAPAYALITKCVAGLAGCAALYYLLRTRLNPDRSTLIALGAAATWLFLYAAHYTAAAFPAAARDGLSQPYQSAVFVANMYYGIAGAVVMYYLVRTWYDRLPSFLAAIGAWTGTSALYYTYAQEAMSHTCSLFAVALYLLLWARLRERGGAWAWAVIGLGLGLVALVRWQDVVFSIIPAIDLLTRNWKANLPKLAVCAGATVLAFVPQMIGWNSLYGSYFTIPQGGAFMSWFRPALIALFFSADHGLITWTPICLAGVAGLFLSGPRLRLVYICLIAAFAVQTYVTACAGNLGWTYGMRRLVGCMPLIALGLAALATRMKTGTWVHAGTVAALAFWNVLFCMQYLGLLNPYYVGNALDAFAKVHRTTPQALVESGKLPDGTPFSLESFAWNHSFPKSGGPTFAQFTTDKLLVFEVARSHLLSPPSR